MTDLIVKHYNELSTDELYKIIQARIEVFVVEQVCPYPDLDDLDQEAVHMWLSDEGRIAAYARIISPSQRSDEYASIGRIVTTTAYRGSGLGKRIVSEGITYCDTYFEQNATKISAQLYLKKFYSSFGFSQIGKVYLEDGIPHISMVR